MSNRNYYKGISLDFKAKQKKDCELEAYIRESMKKCCYPKTVISEYTDDDYYDISASNSCNDCILNSLCCGFMFGIYN
jgi:hypothetical protein